jgi:hypothetical protein
MDCSTCEELIFFDAYHKRWCMRIENGNRDDRNDGFDFTDVEINFCPTCGRDYRDFIVGVDLNVKYEEE